MSCDCDCEWPCPARDAIYLLEDILADELPLDIEDRILNFLQRPEVLPYLAQGTNSDPS